MATGLDLGKQIGPLPLGAWLAVVGGGLGIAWYTRRAGTTPEAVEDTSGVPGVGVGAPAPWTPITGTPDASPVQPTTNEEWGRKVANWGYAQNYPPTIVDSAVRKYLASVPLSVAETAFIAIALVANGAPPQQLPPVEGQDPLPPPGGGGGDTNPPPTVNKPGAPTGLRVLSPSRTQLTIGWNAVPGATAYQVALVSRAQYHDWTGNLNVHRGYTIRGLTPGLPVVIVVRARNAAGNGPWSLPLATRTPR